MASTHKHLRSSTANKRPTTAIAEGQIALNTNSASPGLFFKDSTGASIIKVGPVHVGTTAPNVTPPSGGSSGNSTGEVWLDTSLTPAGVKIWNGSAWVNATPVGSTTVQGLLELATNAETQAGTDTERAVTPAALQSKVSDSATTSSSTTIASSTAVKTAYDLANAALPRSGGTITGNLEIGTTGSLSFEGSTADAFETTIAVTDPTADRTITLPDTTGTVVTTGDSGTVTSTMIANGTIVDADVNASAAIAGTKISPNFGSQNVTTTGTSTAASFIPTSSTVPTNGVYLSAANTVALATASTGRLFIDASGNVGIGASPAVQLDVATADDTQARLRATTNGVDVRINSLGLTGNAGQIGTWSNHPFVFRTNNAERMRLTSDGRLGVGVSSPAALFHAAGAGLFRGSITGTEATLPTETTALSVLHGTGYSTTPSCSINIGANNRDAVNNNEGFRWGITTPGDAGGLALAFSSTSWNGSANVTSERLRITDGGNVGIGTTSPSARLHINGNSATNNLLVNAGTTALAVYNEEAAGEVRLAAIDTSATNAKFLTFYTNPSGSSSGTERARIDSSGRLGVGTSSPQAQLNVAGFSSGSQLPDILITRSSSGTAIQTGPNLSLVDGTTNNSVTLQATQGRFGVWNYGSGSWNERLSITPTGNVGIGTASPAATLHVQGTSGSEQLRVLSPGTGAGGSAFMVTAFDNNPVYCLVTGAGATTGVFGTQTNIPVSFFTNNTERARIDSSGRLLVGTSSARSNFVNVTASAALQVEGSGNSRNVAVVADDNAVDGAYLILAKQRSGSVGGNTIVQSGDLTGSILFEGSDGSEFVDCASIQASVDGTPGTNSMPGRIILSTTSSGASSPTPRVGIYSNGVLSTFTSGASAVTAGSASAAGTTDSLIVGVNARTGLETGGSISFRVWTNGNVVNTNNSYGAISDIKLKENIVNANSQWDDLKALQVRNYNFKEGQTHTQIGLIAQEVELVSPGLVSESPDRDAEGNDLGTVTKSVNYSVLYMKAVKALQEAMERIEILEAKVAALEGA